MSKLKSILSVAGCLVAASAALGQSGPGDNPPPYGQPFFVNVGYITVRYCEIGDTNQWSFTTQHAAAFRITGPTSYEFSQNNAQYSKSGSIGPNQKGKIEFYIHNPNADSPAEVYPGVWYGYTSMWVNRWIEPCEPPIPGNE